MSFKVNLVGHSKFDNPIFFKKGNYINLFFDFRSLQFTFVDISVCDFFINGGCSFKQPKIVVFSLFNSVNCNLCFVFYNSKNLNCIGALSFFKDWSSDFGHAETGNGAKKRVVLQREFFSL